MTQRHISELIAMIGESDTKKMAEDIVSVQPISFDLLANLREAFRKEEARLLAEQQGEPDETHNEAPE